MNPFRTTFLETPDNNFLWLVNHPYSHGKGSKARGFVRFIAIPNNIDTKIQLQGRRRWTLIKQIYQRPKEVRNLPTFTAIKWEGQDSHPNLILIPKPYLEPPCYTSPSANPKPYERVVLIEKELERVWSPRSGSWAQLPLLLGFWVKWEPLSVQESSQANSASDVPPNNGIFWINTRGCIQYLPVKFRNRHTLPATNPLDVSLVKWYSPRTGEAFHR